MMLHPHSQQQLRQTPALHHTYMHTHPCTPSHFHPAFVQGGNPGCYRIYYPNMYKIWISCMVFLSSIFNSCH